MSLGLFVLRVVHLSVSYVRHPVARPFLSPTRTSFVLRVLCLFVLRAFCLVVHRGRRGEERGSDSLASWEDKRMDVVASSWRYFSTQPIINNTPPPPINLLTAQPLHTMTIRVYLWWSWVSLSLSLLHPG